MKPVKMFSVFSKKEMKKISKKKNISGLNIMIIIIAVLSVISLPGCRSFDDNTDNDMVLQDQVMESVDNTSMEDNASDQNSSKAGNEQNDSNNSPEKNQNQSQYSIEQAISDNAQLNTIAFNGLGFLTGNICSDSFLPPGKIADFFGFQYSA